MDGVVTVLRANTQPSIIRTVRAVVEEYASLGVVVGSVANLASVPPPRDMRPTVVARREMAKCRRVLGLPNRDVKR